MQSYFHRSELLLGTAIQQKLQNIKVIIFGVGGVGSWCAEGLIRSGLINLTIVDSDRVCATNINRQIQATSKTIGEVKVISLQQHLLEINPKANITALQKIYSAETADSFNLSTYDIVIDAIDSLTHKKHLIETTLIEEITIFSSMGAALKLDPTKIKIADISKTSGCPLAREVRRHLRKARINKKLLCVFSEEVLPNKQGDSICGTTDCMCPSSENEPGDPSLVDHEWCSGKTQINGSIAYITAIFGFMLTSMVINYIKE